MKRILFVSNHAGFIKFNAPYINWLKQQGFIVDNISPGIEFKYTDCPSNHYDIEICRNPFSLKNIKAILATRKILLKNKYDLIHCHTPMGSIVARIASIGLNCKILYTVHGYHFFKNGPLLGWLLYYPIEKMLKIKTDYIVTINNEDFLFTQTHSMAKNPSYKINGIGFGTQFQAVNVQDKVKLRIELGFSETDFILLYTAQFIKRKNHQFIIECIPKLEKQIPNLKVVFVGNGNLFSSIKETVNQYNLNDIVKFMGGRHDVYKFCQISDVYVSSSFQEGLCISNLEAMACGIPLILSNIRGQNDICKDGVNGYLYDVNDSTKFIDSVLLLHRNPHIAQAISKNNIVDVKKFSLSKSLDSMSKIYKDILRF